MTPSAETPPSAVVRKWAEDLIKRSDNATQCMKMLAADLDAQERLMAEIIAVLRLVDALWKSTYPAGPMSKEAKAKMPLEANYVWFQASALLARIEEKPHEHG